MAWSTSYYANTCYFTSAGSIWSEQWHMVESNGDQNLDSIVFIIHYNMVDFNRGIVGMIHLKIDINKNVII